MVPVWWPADDREFILKVADAVSAVLDPARFNARLDQYREASERVITADPVRVVEATARRVVLAQGEKSSVLHHLIWGGDLSAWGLANAVTRTAEDVPDYDRATELEAAGGRWRAGLVVRLPADAARQGGAAGADAGRRAVGGARCERPRGPRTAHFQERLKPQAPSAAEPDIFSAAAWRQHRAPGLDHAGEERAGRSGLTGGLWSVRAVSANGFYTTRRGQRAPTHARRTAIMRFCRNPLTSQGSPSPLFFSRRVRRPAERRPRPALVLAAAACRVQNGRRPASVVLGGSVCPPILTPRARP
jgi:hypothetical protein